MAHSALFAAAFGTICAPAAWAQQSAVPQAATSIALPLPEDRGAAALEQSLRRLNTWGSLMFIVAHPDDEDGSMLAYESRGEGVRTSLMTLTRGEGGQNAMSADADDALGLMRTQELLKAGEYYGVRQYWGTEADFGFSKTQEEAFRQWGHERVLYDVVLAIRRERPLVLAATFIGGITDGHGQHQVSGEIAQEAYLAAGDPKVFPDQIAAGLRPWTPLKVYARVPFAPITDKRMFDYATGKWAPARFYNYVTKEWTATGPTADVTVPSGKQDPVLGRSYAQIAREGWGEQKTQNGGANPTLSDHESSSYHRYASRVTEPTGKETGFFDRIPTGVEGIGTLIAGPEPEWLKVGLQEMAGAVAKARSEDRVEQPEAIAPTLKQGCEAALALVEKIRTSDLADGDKAALTAEIEIKIAQFHTALEEALGLDMVAYTVRGGQASQGGPFGPGMDETPRSVSPGDAVKVRVHTGNAMGLAKLGRVWLKPSDGKDWKAAEATTPGADETLGATVPGDEAATEPYFSRPNNAQPYYDLTRPELRGDSLTPYPLEAWAEFRYEGLSLPMGQVVETMEREPGRGGVLEPLVVTPKLGVRVEPQAGILPLDGSALPVAVTVHAQAASQGTVKLKLPDGWSAEPAEAAFGLKQAGDSEPFRFLVKPGAKSAGTQTIAAYADADGVRYATGWERIGYAGLRPVNQYRKAELKTRAIDAHLAAGLRVGYVMGTGDEVPQALEGLGVTPHLLSAADVASGDLSRWNVIFVGIRAYSVRPELAAAEGRLDDWVKAGGTMIVQYQSANFPAPLPLTLGGNPEKVVEEDAPVKLLAADNPLLRSPNTITAHDFDGWVEERGHSFLSSWDAGYTALTETADEGQDAQRGGLVVAHPGNGTYVYVAYALYRQLPDLVPGAYRLLANLVSAGH